MKYSGRWEIMNRQIILKRIKNRSNQFNTEYEKIKKKIHNSINNLVNLLKKDLNTSEELNTGELLLRINEINSRRQEKIKDLKDLIEQIKEFTETDVSDIYDLTYYYKLHHLIIRKTEYLLNYKRKWK